MDFLPAYSPRFHLFDCTAEFFDYGLDIRAPTPELVHSAITKHLNAWIDLFRESAYGFNVDHDERNDLANFIRHFLPQQSDVGTPHIGDASLIASRC